MPSGADKIKAILRGAAIGFVAVVILLLVPVIGVRKGLQDLVANWQELALYASCLLTGTIAGARLALNRGSIYEDDDDGTSDTEVSSAGATSASGELHVLVPGHSRPEPELIDFEDAFEPSLAGEPKKRRLGPFVYYFHHDRERTLALLAGLYVILYVNCAALCQKMHLGIIVAGDGDAILRSMGVGITVVGLYLCLRGVMRTGRQRAAGLLSEKSVAEDSQLLKELKTASRTQPSTVTDTASTVEASDGAGTTVPLPSPFRMQGSRLIYASVVSHIPPTRFRFIKRNLICLGALLIFTGLPLVFHAWFPLVAIPGIFIVMSWMFSGDRENPESLVVQGQQ